MWFKRKYLQLAFLRQDDTVPSDIGANIQHDAAWFQIKLVVKISIDVILRVHAIFVGRREPATRFSLSRVGTVGKSIWHHHHRPRRRIESIRNGSATARVKKSP
jgi:hypothetical protein